MATTSTNILLGGILALLVLDIADRRFSLLEYRGGPWILWAETNYFRGDSAWDIEGTFNRKVDCVGQMRATLRTHADISAAQEAYATIGLVEREYKTHVSGDRSVGSRWNTKEKKWEISYMTDYKCLPSGNDPRPRGGK